MENYLSGVSIYQMMIFFKVVEEGGFSNAAIDLYVSQSTISKNISKLEDDLQIKLFERTTRNLCLTEEGMVLYRSWKRLVDDMNRVYVRAKNLGNEKRLSIGLANTTEQKKYFLPIQQQLATKESGVDMLVECGSIDELVYKLDEGYYDLVMVPDFERYTFEDMGLPWRWVQKAPAQVVMPSQHRCARKHVVEVADILSEEFLNLNGKTTGNYERDLCERFQKYNAVPRIKHAYGSEWRNKAFFDSSSELLFVDYFYVYGTGPNTVKRPVKDEYNGIICAWNSNRENMAVNQFLNCI